jgi:hypothetical protein
LGALAFGSQTLGGGRRGHCRTRHSGTLIGEDGLRGGVGGSEAIAEFLVLTGRVDQSPAFCGRECDDTVSVLDLP